MAVKVYRSSNITKVYSITDTRLIAAASYKVGAFPPGGVAGTVSGGGPYTIALEAGHGFSANDKFILNPTAGAAPGTLYEVATAAATQITTTTSDVQTGDVLFNLGPDAGAPAYNAGRSIYSDIDGQTTLTDKTATTDSNGNFGYYHDIDVAAWELLRDSTGTIQGYTINAWPSHLKSYTDSAFVDNAIVRWHGTDGLTVQEGYTGTEATIDDDGTIRSPAAVITTLTTTTFTPTTIAGNPTFSGNVVNSGSLRLASSDLTISASGAIAVAGKGLINATISGAGSYAMTLTAPSSVDGQLLVIRVGTVSAGTTTLSESTTAILVGTSWTMAANATLTLIAKGSLWYELARSAN